MDVDLGHLRKPCACGQTHEIDIRDIYIESGAVTYLMDILENYQNPVFICDSNTRAAAEPFLEEEFKDYPIIELDPDGLCAEEKTIDKVLTQLEFCERGCTAVCVDILVAIGAGTIHDIAGYCAKEYGIGFVSIPTAASTDGFTSDEAHITWNGMEKVLPSAAPAWILADTDIFAKAPSYLTSAGVSLAMEKYSLLQEGKASVRPENGNTSDEAVDMVNKALRDVERSIGDIHEGDEEGMEKLMYALLICGMAVQTA